MIFDAFLGAFSTDLGIDLGTANTLVCLRGRGIVLAEPSVVAVRKGTSQVLMDGNAVGHVAKPMLDKTPPGIEAIRPLRDGVIADFDMTEAMLNYFIRKANPRKWIRPRVVIAVPSGITPVEKRAVYDSATRAGARKVYLIEEPRAAAIGAGIRIQDPYGSMVVDIGGGTTEIAILSLAEVVERESLRVAGDHFDAAISSHMRNRHNLLIGSQTSERVKLELGSALALDEELTMTVNGRDILTGLPRPCLVGSGEIREALGEALELILRAICRVIERSSPELVGDLCDRGIVLCGGGALMPRLDELIHERTGLPVRIADDPLCAVARGTAIFLDHLGAVSGFLESEDQLAA